MVSQSRRKRQFAVCAAVYNEAKKKGVGREIPAEWFTQSIRTLWGGPGHPKPGELLMAREFFDEVTLVSAYSMKTVECKGS